MWFPLGIVGIFGSRLVFWGVLLAGFSIQLGSPLFSAPSCSVVGFKIVSACRQTPDKRGMVWQDAGVSGLI